METRATEGEGSALAGPGAAPSAQAGSGGRRWLLAFSGSYLLWLLLTASLDPQECLAGLPVALLVAALGHRHLGYLDDLRLRPQLPFHLLRYLGVFLAALVVANLDMARRVLAPRVAIRPGVVEVRTALRSPIGRLLLANSITLTPGTLTVDVVDDRLIVHWVDTSPGADLEHATAAIAVRFERHLQEIFS